MSRKLVEIKVVAYCHVGDKLVNMNDLTKEQKAKAATWIMNTFMNEMYRGKAKFEPKDVSLLEGVGVYPTETENIENKRRYPSQS